MVVEVLKDARVPPLLHLTISTNQHLKSKKSNNKVSPVREMNENKGGRGTDITRYSDIMIESYLRSFVGLGVSSTLYDGRGAES
jgi:hypothetical protein